jgi:biotin carboxyl carrier protein
MPNVPTHVAGTVIRLEKSAGDAVAAGETVLVLRSDGMEVPLESPASGRVRQIRVKEGQVVAAGDVLVVVE